MVSADSLELLNLDSSAIFTGQSANRSLKVWKCCSASSVVGHRITTCLLSATAANVARNATSVLPKPTSPHTRRSIGLPDAMSVITASIAAAWSTVSSKPKPSANASRSCCRMEKEWPRRAARFAYSDSNSAAVSRTWRAARALALSHWPLPSLCSGASSGCAPL